MSTNSMEFDELLNSTTVGRSDVVDYFGTGTDSPDGVPWSEPGYTGAIDYRIRQISYSSLLTLHSCPRKFQLYRLKTTFRTQESDTSNITFAFGHIVGDAIQAVFQGLPLDEILLRMFLGWHAPLDAVIEKDKKSFWTAVIAVQKFISMREAGFLSEYDLVSVDGVPACEFSFAVTFPDGFRLRGSVDAVLRNRITDRIIVLEVKTTGNSNLNPALYKNSAQGVGYSVVLDQIFSGLTGYDVMYLVYQTKEGAWNPIPFPKTQLQKALWIRELLLDIEMIKMYEDAGVYPMRGESCFSFYRECEYFNTCQMSTKYLTSPPSEADEDTTEYRVNITLMDLLDSQISESTSESSES